MSTRGSGRQSAKCCPRWSGSSATYVHFLRNALDYVPRNVDDDCLMELRWLYDRRDLAEVAIRSVGPARLVGMEPRVYRYRPSRSDDAGFRKRLRELAAERRRFGCRRLHLLLKREGVAVDKLYREERLTVRKRGGRKRALGTKAPMAIPQGANQRWSLDFVSDTLTDGRRFHPVRHRRLQLGVLGHGRRQLDLG